MLLKPDRHSLGGALNFRRRREADVRFVIYVRPSGRDHHIVRSPNSATEKRVTALEPGITYKPGTTVPVASHTGHAEEVMLGRAPLEGTAEFATEQTGVPLAVGFGLSGAIPTIVILGAQLVQMIGFGFRASPPDKFRAVVWNATTNVWDSDPDVTITLPVFVTSTRVDAIVTVAAGVPTGRTIDVEVLRG